MVTRFTFRIYKTAVAILATASSLCFSQSRKDSVKETEIQKVNVYKKNFKEILPAQTLSGEQLERLNSQSVADALRYFSGVQIKDYGGFGGLKTINIRSMGSQHVGVFYDGIELGNAQNGVVDLGKFSLDDIEEISLYNGQKSEIFQPAKDFGSSSSIYLQPKTPSFKFNKKTNLVLRLKNSSIDLFNPSFRLEQKISDKVSASFSSEFLQSDGVYKYHYKRKFLNGSIAYDTIAKRFDGDVKTKRFETGIYGKLNNGDWNIRGYGFLSDRGIPAPIVKNRFDGRGQRLKDENYFIQASIKKKLFPKLESQLKAKFAYDYTYFADTVKLQTAYPVENTYIQREVYVSSSNLYSLTKNWDVSLSGDFQFNNLDASLVNFSYPTRYTSLVALASTYRFRNLKFLGSLLGTFVHETVEKNTKAPDKSEWTPAFFMSYQPFGSEDFTVRTFYKKMFRMPTFNDLYYTRIGYSFLKPEFTDQYDVGLTYQKVYENQIFKSFYIKADGYFNKVKDKIIASPIDSFRWTMMNLGEVEIIGADVNIQAELDFGKLKIRPLLSYTYQSALDFTDRNDTYFGDQIPYIPWHSGTITTMLDWKNWSLNYSFIYAGERYDMNQNNIAYNNIPPWYTHDLSIQKKIDWKSHQFKVSLEVNNLLDRYYDVVLNYPMPGRNFKLIINFTL